MLNKKYFQTLLRKQDDKKNICCNTLVLFYKGMPITDLYIDEINTNIINMSAATRKKYAWDNFSFLIEEMGEHLINDDINYPIPERLLNRKELTEALEWD